MYLLLYEPLPLRTSRMLGDFADDFVLAHRLGDLRTTRFHLRKLSDTVWFAADHAMEITAVQIDDAPIAGWASELRSDADGNTWTVVLLAAPAPPNASVTASGLGARDPRTGRLIENPADVAEYLLRLAGRTETFPLLRAECAAAGIALAGSLDVSDSIRSLLDQVMYSAGAIWTPGAARLYPKARGNSAVLDLGAGAAENIVPTADVEDTCDILRVSYNVDEATDRAQQYVELQANPWRYGGISAEIVLKWVRTAANAESIGRRILGRMAGELYSVALTTDQISIRPCQWVRLISHPGWPIDDSDPELMTLATDITPDQNSAEVTLEYVTNSPAIRVTAHSVAVPIGIGAAVDVAIANGIVTFGISDDNGQPLRDALVSLDGGAAKKTDAQGKVRFSITPADPPRKHQLAVQAPGFTPFLLDVYL